ncbi:hypothetical protein M413DRAFT_198673 [Hebeloma cylindrosporum]|uniref:DUF6533 domain-containing protein n=1 Tax=Hebeloma cylindrosporum TaxID=76867 RepID=A0A0C2YED4_HEBCY|nr:hypothetical protein M413DRAFT_198673 [Hebeloma cylindrosporum h7]
MDIPFPPPPPPPIPQPLLSIVAIHQRNYWSCAALITLIWDWAISLEDEVQYIWKSPSMTNKWVYLVSRYLGIISQVVDSAIILSNGCKPVPKEICRTWMSFENASSMILFAIIEFIQCLRVYAFYNKNAKLGILLSVWFCGGMGAAIYYLWYGFSPSHMDFDPSCAVIHIPLISIIFGAIPIANQAIALSLLFWRRKVVAPGYLEAVPVAYVVLRDGFLLFFATCGIMGIAMVYITKKAHPIYLTP